MSTGGAAGPLTHRDLVDRAVRWLAKSKGCTVACGELVSSAGETPDAIGWRGETSYLVECKMSRADFLADRKKAFRLSPASGIGSLRWYLTPPGLLRPAEISDGWGLLELNARGLREIVAPTHQPASRERETVLLLSVIKRMKRPGCWPVATNARVWIEGEPLSRGFVVVDGVRHVVTAEPPASTPAPAPSSEQDLFSVPTQAQEVA